MVKQGYDSGKLAYLVRASRKTYDGGPSPKGQVLVMFHFRGVPYLVFGGEGGEQRDF
jgi:hypothetical protein